MVLGLRAPSCQIPALAASIALALAPGLARAETDTPNLALDASGGRPVAPPRARPAPADAPIAACSFVSPVCVHTTKDTHPSAAASVLVAAERAFAALDALRLPKPLGDGMLGDSPAFDIYVIPGTPDTTTTADFLPRADKRDVASAFTVMPPPPANAGCALASSVARSIGEAVVLGLDSGAEDSAIAMESSYFATLAAPCSSLELEAVDAFQRAPERSLASASRSRLDGALLFPWFLDDQYGHGANAAVFTALLTVSGQSTPRGSFNYENEPDLWDALRANAKTRNSTLDELLLELAISRAFVGTRDDGQHLGDAARFGDFGRVRFEWSVPFETLPRRFAPLRPIEPLGATYLWIDLKNAPPGSDLTLAADWEVFSLFRWAFVKVDKSGAETARMDVPAIFGSTHVEKTIVGLDGLSGVLLVGINAGSPDRSHPFDPDELPYTAHSYEVTLVK